MTTPVDEQKKAEARQRYADWTKRIAAIDHDIALETDGEQLALLHVRRSDAVKQRDLVQREMGGEAPYYTDTSNEIRIGDLETRVTRLEYNVKPPWQVTMWRLFSLLVAVLGGMLYATDATHVVLFHLYLPLGIGTMVFLACVTAVLWHMAAVTLEHHK